VTKVAGKVVRKKVSQKRPVTSAASYKSSLKDPKYDFKKYIK